METINRQFKAAIFDMDGLILDSERTVLSCWEKIGEKYGFKDIVTYGISVIGKNKKATIDEFERIYGEPGDRYERELREIYNGLAQKGEVPLKPHTLELLESMKNAGMKIAIASSSTREGNTCSQWYVACGFSKIPIVNKIASVIIPAVSMTPAPGQCMILKSAPTITTAAPIE